MRQVVRTRQVVSNRQVEIKRLVGQDNNEVLVRRGGGGRPQSMGRQRILVNGTR